MDTIVYGPIHGAQRILTVFDDHVLLEQVQNFRSFLTHDFFNGDKEIYYVDMISCQFKEGSSLILGYLQFETPGVSNSNNFGSENSFTFEAVYNGRVYEIYQYIKSRIREYKNGGRIQIIASSPQEETKSSNSNLDELLKMKKLLDQNIITQEEFDDYKSQILQINMIAPKTITYNAPKPKNWECSCGVSNDENETKCWHCGAPRKDY